MFLISCEIYLKTGLGVLTSEQSQLGWTAQDKTTDRVLCLTSVQGWSLPLHTHLCVCR